MCLVDTIVPNYKYTEIVDCLLNLLPICIFTIKERREKLPLGRKYSFRRCSTEPGWYHNQPQYTWYWISYFSMTNFVKLVDFYFSVKIWVLIRTSISPTLFQVSITRQIRYVNSSMVPDIDFGSIQNWMYEYLYICYSLLKIPLLPLTVALLHFLIISLCLRLILLKLRTCSMLFNCN